MHPAVDRDEARRFVVELYKIDEVRFGHFVLKNKTESPVYIDTRGVGTYPLVLAQGADLCQPIFQQLVWDHIAGLPYAGMPFATAIGLRHHYSVLYAPKEQKEYGTGKKLVQGHYGPGDIVAIFDNVITDGASKIELIPPYLEEKLIIRDFIVLVDREQGGEAYLKKHNYNLHSAMTGRDLYTLLEEAGSISEEERDVALNYFDDPISYGNNRTIQASR